MLPAYIRAATGRARYKILPDGTYFGEIPGIGGVWADAPTLEACRDELESVLEEWIALSLTGALPIPVMGAASIVVSQVP